MGQSPSLSPEEQLANYGRYAEELFNSQHWQGFGIDSSLQRFSGLNSTEELIYYRDHVLYSEGYSQAANTIERLGSALAGFKSVPNAVGLGALIISMILEAVGKSLHKETLGTAEILQRVFAQEKANEVRDLMEEYLKRLQINLGNQQLQLTETRQIETDLSVQLTRLKNSMLKDGHMNTQFLKQWVNGAAFHTQMLIHQARLEGTAGSRASQAAGLYQQQLNLLLEKYKKYLETVIHVSRESVILCSANCYTQKSNYCSVKYTESQKSTQTVKVLVIYDITANPFIYECITAKEMVEGMFSKPQITWASSYFSDLQGNVSALVQQNSSFHLYI